MSEGVRPQHTFLRPPQASPKTATVHTQTSPFFAAFTAMQEDWGPSCNSLQVQRPCRLLRAQNAECRLAVRKVGLARHP